MTKTYHGPDLAEVRRDRLVKFFRVIELIPDRDMPLECHAELRNAPAAPFMGRYLLRVDGKGAAVFDGETQIASYMIGRLGSRLRVIDSYQGQGIAPNLIVAWWRAHPNRLPPDRITKRTRGGYRAGLRALSILYPDIPLHLGD